MPKKNKSVLVCTQTLPHFVRIIRALIKREISAEKIGDSIALCAFYLVNTINQKTNSPLTNVAETAKTLKWGATRVRRARKDLLNSRIINDFKIRKNGRAHRGGTRLFFDVFDEQEGK